MLVGILSKVCYRMLVQASRNNRQGLDIGTCESLVSCDIIFCMANFDPFSSKIYLKEVTIFIPLK